MAGKMTPFLCDGMIVLTGEIYSKKSYHAVDWEMTIRSIDYLDRADSKSTWVIVAEFL